MDGGTRKGEHPTATEPDWIGLWEGCLVDSPAATRAFVTAAYPLIESVYFSRIQNPEDARDLVQRFFLKLFEDGKRRLRLFDPNRGIPLPAFLCVVAVRLLIDWTRSREVVHKSDVISWEDVDLFLGVEPRAERDLMKRELSDALESLPETERIATMLRLRCLRSAEIGAVIGMSSSGVDNLLWKTRQKLRALLDGVSDSSG